MSGTNEIDVFQYWYVDKEALVRDGVLADITDRIAAEEADIDPADFLGALYDAYTLVDGRRYGLPYDGDTHVLFYNKEILDRNGLQPPATWDEYNAVAKAVTEAESANGVYGALLMCKQFPIILCSTYANRLGGYGGDFLDANGAPALTSDAAIGAAQTMLEAGPYAVPTPLETEFGNSIPVFLSGGAAMIEFWTDLGTWAQDANQSQIVDKWGVVAHAGRRRQYGQPAGDERGLVLRRLVRVAQPRDGVGVRAHVVEQGFPRPRAHRQHDRRGPDPALGDARLSRLRAAAGGRRGAGHRRRLPVADEAGIAQAHAVAHGRARPDDGRRQDRRTGHGRCPGLLGGHPRLA